MGELQPGTRFKSSTQQVCYEERTMYTLTKWMKGPNMSVLRALLLIDRGLQEDFPRVDVRRPGRNRSLHQIVSRQPEVEGPHAANAPPSACLYRPERLAW